MLNSFPCVVIISYQALGQIMIKVKENNNDPIAPLLTNLQWLAAVYQMNLSVSGLYN